MPKLSNTQTVLLATAAARPDRSILPAPETLKVKSAALERTLAALLRHKLIAHSCDGERGGHLECAGTVAGNGTDGSAPLVITSSGLAAIGIEPSAARTGNSAAEPDPDIPAIAKAEPPRPGGKLGLLLDLVSGANGATLEDLTSASGWLPHTTRAALTRLRQRGYEISLVPVGDRKSYRLGAAG